MGGRMGGRMEGRMEGRMGKENGRLKEMDAAGGRQGLPGWGADLARRPRGGRPGFSAGLPIERPLGNGRRGGAI